MVGDGGLPLRGAENPSRSGQAVDPAALPSEHGAAPCFGAAGRMFCSTLLCRASCGTLKWAWPAPPNCPNRRDMRPAFAGTDGEGSDRMYGGEGDHLMSGGARDIVGVAYARTRRPRGRRPASVSLAVLLAIRSGSAERAGNRARLIHAADFLMISAVEGAMDVLAVESPSL